MSIRKGLLMIFVSLLVLVAGCGSKATETEKEKEVSGSPAEKPKLQMVTAATFPPFEFTDTTSETSEIKGLDIDIAEYIATELGFEFEITSLTFSSIVAAIKEGRADFSLTGMLPTPERKENVDFSDIYFIPREAIIWKEDDKTEYTSINQLEGKKVGVSLSSVQEKKIQSVQDTVVTSMNGNAEVIKEISAGRVDAGFMISTQAESFLETNKGLKMHIVEKDPQDKLGFAIALPKDSEWTEKFNTVLEEMKENGELDKIILKWLGSEYIEG